MMTMTKMKMMTISEPVLRRGTLDDLEQIAIVEERAFGIHAYDYPSLRYMLKKTNAITVVSEVDGKVAGYATVYIGMKSRIAHIESIAVDPDYQGTGLGRRMLLELERISLERGCHKIVLETFENNKAAMNFYKNSGYVFDKVVNDYYVIPYDGSRNAVKFHKFMV
jgi:ribosomal-protein-alanine N-acetyltransferase